MEEKDPILVLSSILSHFYKDALDESQYKDISVGKKRERNKKKSNSESSYSDRRKEDRERDLQGSLLPGVETMVLQREVLQMYSLTRLE